MSSLGPNIARCTALLALFLVMVAVTPASAHEGQDPSALTVLARVDGRVQGLSLDRTYGGTVAFPASVGQEVHLVDLNATETPATAIDFEVNATRPLRLEVLDLEGTVVRTLARGTWAEGTHTLAWHHDSESGESLEDGLYVVRLRPESPRETQYTAR